MNNIKLIVVEDQTILRETLVEVLGREPGIEITGDWGSGEELIDILSQIDLDIAVIDNFLPGMDGITLTRKIKKARPDVRIIMLSVMTREDFVFESLEAGVSGYLPKDVSVNELVQAIKSVGYGETVISSKVSQSFIKYCANLKKDKKQQSLLTDEQLKIIRLAREGHINKEISERLEIPLSTVKFNFREICRKLDARDRTQAVIKAMEMNLISSDLD
jgi:DNA-binding NarL/FixJ family response regulator